MNDIICNLHIHTIYSDGSGTYQSIAEAAMKTGVDVLILTDHNIYVDGIDGYRSKDDKKVLLIAGEEVHDPTRNPQKNHTLVIGASQEMSQFGRDPQNLMNEVKKSGGLSFLAHPFEFPLAMFDEPDISWVSWEVQDFTGVELWNGMSEFKTVSQSLKQAIFYSFFPEFVAHAPLTSMLNKWDDLLTLGKKVVAVGGSDSHAIHFQRGILKKIIYPYEYHFSAINNHLLSQEPLTGDVESDKHTVYEALRNGSSFIGYDLPASTKGFTFTIENQDAQFTLGQTLDISEGGTVRIHTPQKAKIRLIHDGKVVSEQIDRDILVCTVTAPGYYRVECEIEFLGKSRGWIYSNPIYTTSKKKNK